MLKDVSRGPERGNFLFSNFVGASQLELLQRARRIVELSGRNMFLFSSNQYELNNRRRYRHRNTTTRDIFKELNSTENTSIARSDLREGQHDVRGRSGSTSN